MKEIYIIRHGETDYNKKGSLQGSGVDKDLNEVGRQQANMFYECYKDIAFDKVYISTLIRTYQTVENFVLNRHVPCEKLEGLDEINWGIYEGKSIHEIKSKVYNDLIQHWEKGNYQLKAPEGESLQDISDRQLKAIDHMFANKNEQRILICIHGRALGVLLCNILQEDLSKMQKFPHQNLSLYRLKKENRKFKVLDFNNTSHLNGQN